MLELHPRLLKFEQWFDIFPQTRLVMSRFWSYSTIQYPSPHDVHHKDAHRAAASLCGFAHLGSGAAKGSNKY